MHCRCRRSWAACGASFLLALFLLSGPVVARAANQVTPRRIGIIPFYTPDKISQLYQPFIQYLNTATQITWELKLGDTHDDLVRNLCTGEVSVAYLGPIPFAKALEQCAPHPLLISLGREGQPTYRSMILTADPAVRSLSDLRGKKFAFFENSTAAHYLPLSMLATAGLGQNDIIPIMLSSQDRIVAAILSGEVAAGGVKESLYSSFQKTNLRVLEASQPLPQFILCAAPGVPVDVERALTEALLKLKPQTNEKDRALMQAWDPEVANGFSPPPADYGESTRKLLRAVQPFLKR